MADGSALLADIAGQGRQARPRHAHFFAVVVEMVASIDGRRRILRVHACKLADGVGRDLGDLFGPLRRVLRHMLLEERPCRGDLHAVDLERALHGRVRHGVEASPRVRIGIPDDVLFRVRFGRNLVRLRALQKQHAVERVLRKLHRAFLAEVGAAQEVAVVLAHQQRSAGVLAHEVQVVPFVLDDDVEHGHTERRVGTGLDGNPLRRLAGSDGVRRVDDDQVRAGLLRLDAEVPAVRLRVWRVGIPDEQGLRKTVVARHVALVEVPAATGHLADADQVAVVQAHVHTLEPERVAEAEAGHETAVRGERVTGRNQDAVGAKPIVLGVVHQRVRHELRGLVPGQALPFVGPTVLHVRLFDAPRLALHRVQHAVEVVQAVRMAETTHANTLVRRIRKILVGTDVDHPAFAHGRDHRAAALAVAAAYALDLLLVACGRLCVLRNVGKSSQRASADCGSAGDGGGSLEKASARDSLARDLNLRHSSS